MLRVLRGRVGALAEADSEGHASDAGRSLNSRVTCRRGDSGSSGAPSVRHAVEGSGEHHGTSTYFSLEVTTVGKKKT